VDIEILRNRFFFRNKRAVPFAFFSAPVVHLLKMLTLAIMDALIVHPQDITTEFLKGIYRNLDQKRVLTSQIPKLLLRKKIERGDPGGRLVFCGHGCSSGLFGAGHFPDADGLIIDESMVEALRTRTNVFYIWCNANKFVQRHSLMGFHTGMFISQLDEA
jgi:hypothetical protein